MSNRCKKCKKIVSKNTEKCKVCGGAIVRITPVLPRDNIATPVIGNVDDLPIAVAERVQHIPQLEPTIRGPVTTPAVRRDTRRRDDYPEENDDGTYTNYHRDEISDALNHGQIDLRFNTLLRRDRRLMHGLDHTNREIVEMNRTQRRDYPRIIGVNVRDTDLFIPNPIDRVINHEHIPTYHSLTGNDLIRANVMERLGLISRAREVGIIPDNMVRRDVFEMRQVGRGFKKIKKNNFSLRIKNNVIY